MVWLECGEAACSRASLSTFFGASLRERAFLCVFEDLLALAVEKLWPRVRLDENMMAVDVVANWGRWVGI